jgi:glycosyltransferase A (GT-A) superfamily protein (DUF2064 family)
VSARLYLAARAPRLGLNKTRLARAVGDESALDLYRGFLRDLSARLRRRGLPLGWFVSPWDAWPELAAVVGPGRRPEPVAIQPEGDWTERQRALFAGAAARGETRTLLMATDSPQIDAREVERALAALERRDLVLGPVEDGGYYLLGMRGWHDVLAGVAMGVGDVAGAILANAGRLGLSVALLDPTFDVDEIGDLAALERACDERGDLPETARALALCLAAPA